MFPRRHRVARIAASLEVLSPLAVLARGYSLTFLADGKTLVRASDDVKTGDGSHRPKARRRQATRRAPAVPRWRPWLVA